LGFVWPCHYYLYEMWSRGGPLKEFAVVARREFDFKAKPPLFDNEGIAPIGHLLDPGFRMDDLSLFHPCNFYGRCIGCDTKIKNDRFQSYYDRGVPHTSVIIKNIRMPLELRRKIENPDRAMQFLYAETLENANV